MTSLARATRSTAPSAGVVVAPSRVRAPGNAEGADCKSRPTAATLTVAAPAGGGEAVEDVGCDAAIGAASATVVVAFVGAARVVAAAPTNATTTVGLAGGRCGAVRPATAHGIGDAGSCHVRAIGGRCGIGDAAASCGRARPAAAAAGAGGTGVRVLRARSVFDDAA